MALPISVLEMQGAEQLEQSEFFLLPITWSDYFQEQMEKGVQTL